MRAFTQKNRLTQAILGMILLGALFFRLYDISWDRGYLFHPDERQILIVVDELSFPWPPDWSLLLTPESPWNPSFFAYGSLPIYLLRICASLAGKWNPALATLESSYMVGRVLSAFFDVGTIYLLYRLGRKLYDRRTGLLAAGFLSLTVLHIQLSHFYTVDTLLAFFTVLVVLLAVDMIKQPSMGRGMLMGVAWGVALATKVSAAPLLVTVYLAWFLGILAPTEPLESRGNEWGRIALWGRAILGCGLTGLVAAMTFLLFEPYALIDLPTFLVDVLHEGFMARGVVDLPYTRQFIGTAPYLYPIWQTMVWSMGIPLGLTGFAAAVAAAAHAVVLMVRAQWERASALWMPVSWVLTYFALIGSFHAKFLRYMTPLIPFLCLWAAWLLWRLYKAAGEISRLRRALAIALLVVVCLGTGLYAVSYLNVYTQEHPWIQATAWLCENVPAGSRILVEHWDDPLPLLQGTGDLRCYYKNEVSVFRAYDPDDTSKFERLMTALLRDDYIILSSNRLYNTIPRLPDRYPLASRYYDLLMSERLGFELVHYVAVYPRILGLDLVNDTFSDPDLPVPRLLAEQEATRFQINLGRADESFTVYDHPKPLIFQKTRQLTLQELVDLFGDIMVRLPLPEPE
ncbi:MAG: hypothetical protein A2Y73_01580 [Chloroflexi bacterium RBG_13_56_8]|nr:MAG: hypothetical protein A2Y73_01580 [Chloroflexi bacterium RBG_13_56_8]